MIKKKDQEKQKLNNKTKLPGSHLLGLELVANRIREKKEEKMQKKTNRQKQGENKATWFSSSGTGACSKPCKRSAGDERPRERTCKKIK